MMSQMCPKGMEATLYALLAGCHNMGGAISDYFGAFVLEYLSCNPSGTSLETAKFDNLWKASNKVPNKSGLLRNNSIYVNFAI